MSYCFLGSRKEKTACVTMIFPVIYNLGYGHLISKVLKTPLEFPQLHLNYACIANVDFSASYKSDSFTITLSPSTLHGIRITRYWLEPRG